MNTMHPTAKRLYEAVQHLTGVTGQSAVAKKINISPQTLYNWEVRGVSHSAMVNLEREFGIPARWLIDGEPIDMPGQQAPVNEPRATYTIEATNDVSAIHRYKFKANAGIHGIPIELDESPGHPIYFRNDWLKSRGFDPARLVALRVTGSSMEPTIYADDLVVINLADDTPRDGEVFLVSYEGEPGIKRLNRDGPDWMLMSDNADQKRYAPKRCTPDTKVLGRVVYRQTERI